jgi:hypothetical protein
MRLNKINILCPFSGFWDPFWPVFDHGSRLNRKIFVTTQVLRTQMLPDAARLHERGNRAHVTGCVDGIEAPTPVLPTFMAGER